MLGRGAGLGTVTEERQGSRHTGTRAMVGPHAGAVTNCCCDGDGLMRAARKGQRKSS